MWRSPEPTAGRPAWTLYSFIGLLVIGAPAAMTRPTNPVLLSDRLRDLTAELSLHAPESADRLLRAKTAREFLEVVRELFNLASTFTPDHYSLLHSEDLSKQIATFISHNLHRYARTDRFTLLQNRRCGWPLEFYSKQSAGLLPHRES